MIASDRTAVKVGSALLVVDGTDETITRKAEFSLRPTRAQAHAIERGLLQLSRDAYNAALQERRDAWRWAGVSVSAFEQFSEIDAELEVTRPDIARFGIQPVRSAIRRADEAMAAFFRRVKGGEETRLPALQVEQEVPYRLLRRAGLLGTASHWCL